MAWALNTWVSIASWASMNRFAVLLVLTAALSVVQQICLIVLSQALQSE